MMNSNLTSKIVVGIGLAAVVGIGVYEFNVHAEQQQENRIALNASAPAMPDLTSQSAADALTPDLSASPTAPPEAVPTPSKTSNFTDESKPAKLKRSDRVERQVAKTRNTEPTPAETVVLPASSATSRSALTASNNPDSVTSNKEMTPSPSSTDTTSAATAATTADAQPAPAQTGQVAAASTEPAAPSNAAVASDSQITAYVKSEIATAAPNSNVDVKTTNGVVALAGSVPSQDAIDQARQAAQRVAGVKFVDASALMVSNQ
jgi:hyperosmotically inducible protein